MSLFQCQVCGCVENTALSFQGCPMWPDSFDWAGIEDREGKRVCSACAPEKFKDGTSTGLGNWHGRFDRTYLPLGMFKTNKKGNVEHVVTGDENFRAHAIKTEVFK